MCVCVRVCMGRWRAHRQLGKSHIAHWQFAENDTQQSYWNNLKIICTYNDGNIYAQIRETEMYTMRRKISFIHRRLY